MAVTLTYDATLSRVQINANALAAASYATVERSTDGINWTTVRGGSDVGVTAGAFDLPVDDYEFSADVSNTYRVRGVVTGPITYVAIGSGHSNGNAAGTGTISPGLPGSLVAGDLLVAVVTARNTAARVDVPVGWTMMREDENVAYVGRRYVAGDVAPTWSWTGDVANATLLGIIFAFRNAELVPFTGVSQANASAQNIAYPALTVPADNLAIVVSGWKQDDQTGTGALAGMTSIADLWDTAGDDAMLAIDYVIQTTAANIVAGSFSVSGGAAAVSRGTVVALEHAAYLNEQTASITPTLTAIWLKSISRPFLNQTVEIVQPSGMGVTRPARTGVFDIVGRSFPVAVNDVRKSRRWTMLLRTEDDTAKGVLELLLASGDVILIQVPASCDHIPHGYVSVGDVDQTWHPIRPRHVLHVLPVVEVAPPGADVIGASVTWQTVINAYASWNDLLAAQASWASTLTLVGSPSEVIVA